MDIKEAAQRLIDISLAEDLGEQGDITSQATISEDKIITAHMVVREEGVLAGIDIAAQVFKTVDPDLKISIFIKDGSKIQRNNPLLKIEGSALSILKAERTALNLLSHLSAIATETAKYVEAVKETNAKILDTRKTLPAYRMLHKYAVKMGGGTNHRFGLYDMILIKDNHIAAAGSVEAALDGAKNSNHGVKIEIEIDTLEQLQEVLKHGGADIVMLDNMPLEILKEAVNIIDGALITEASGGVNLETVQAIAQSGVDLISIGALTHSVKALDIGLDS